MQLQLMVAARFGLWARCLCAHVRFCLPLALAVTDLYALDGMPGATLVPVALVWGLVLGVLPFSSGSRGCSWVVGGACAGLRQLKAAGHTWAFLLLRVCVCCRRRVLPLPAARSVACCPVAAAVAVRCRGWLLSVCVGSV